MSDSPTTIRLTPALQRFLADRLQRDDRGARGPWTRTAILTTLAERYGYLLQSAGDLPAIPEATIRSCLGSLVL
ncbi:MAG: hypothetical protein JF614_32410, partial [Acidobacteria bacterium]|nr:hypothetical protein [Acidobacteriota bacterium]